MKMPPEEAARHFIQHTFPYCETAILGGSAAQKTITEQSDLDIVIVDETASTSYRECFNCFDWNIEAFIFQPDSLVFAFDMSGLEGIPTVPRLCADGIILKDDHETGANTQELAKQCIQNGPLKWPEKQRQQMRFTITNLLDDLNSDHDEKEKLFSAYKLFDLIPRFILRTHQRWIGEGKWMYRALRAFDEQFCEKYLEVFDIYMKTGNTMPLHALIEEVLKANGGRLFEGYKDYL